TFNDDAGCVSVTCCASTVAESTDVIALHEDSRRTRYYFPKSDVDFEVLETTSTSTRCPWKGQDSYWTARIGDKEYQDIAWGYEEPLPEAEAIAGRVCFYDEKVDLEIRTT